ncbi:MEDS domain-containing protein [Microbispora rosea]|uniref:MEDS domain-containing protein n=1 Tax=Microbispora rosea TaxID=58117 RepID=UPI00343AED12
MTVSAEVQITDLAINDHACLTFGEPEELLDLTAAFVRDGLAGGLRVVWLCEEPQGAAAELSRRGIAVQSATASGRMDVVASQESLLSGRTFDLDHAMGWLNSQMELTSHEGYSGLRVALDMGWALRPVHGVEQLPAFEEKIATILSDSSVSVLCQYDRERFDPVTLASVSRFTRGRSPRPPTTTTRCCGSAASTRRPASGWRDRSTERPRTPWPWR